MIKTRVYVGITPPTASFLFSPSMHTSYFDLIATSPLAMPLSFAEMDYFAYVNDPTGQILPALGGGLQVA
jgi:hypothetical protein